MTPGWERVWQSLGLTVALLLGLGAAWNLGFAQFAAAAHRPGEAPGQADGIVVLTGGADRVEAALQLLADGHAPRLLVSGVRRGTDLAQVVPPELALSERVTLGRIAQTTVGNAAETAAWVHRHGVRRLIVVTAGYHMPRALLELQRAVPGVELVPVAVLSPALRGGMPAATLRLLANEYDKLLAVRLGLARALRYGEGA